MSKMEIEWEARWSGGMKESAVLVNDSGVVAQSEFSQHIHHIMGGYELYRADVTESDTVVLLYISGSGKTQCATELTGQKRKWEYWDDAERDLQLVSGSLEEAFWCV